MKATQLKDKGMGSRLSKEEATHRVYDAIEDYCGWAGVGTVSIQMGKVFLDTEDGLIEIECKVVEP